MAKRVTIVGGGLGGLVAAAECAERGMTVELLEARSRLGGRAASTPGPWVANLGPHAVYTGGALWDWLTARKLDSGFVKSPMIGYGRMRWKGAFRRTPPAALLKALKIARKEAPVDQDLRTWLSSQLDDASVQAAIGIVGNLVFDHDPGRFSAAFMMEKVRRITLGFPPVTRYPVGGWGAMVESIAEYARSRGVRIVTGEKVDALPEAPVIVAVEPGAARRLLGDDSLRPPTTHTALLDVGFKKRRRGRITFNLVDLDEAGFAENFSMPDSTLAPKGHELVQALVGMRPGETLDSAVARLEPLVDLGWPGWREDEAWRKRYSVKESSGALDLPGTTWRDRTPVNYADGVWLVGDWVAAPGHLAEVSVASAVMAAKAVAGQGSLSPAR